MAEPSRLKCRWCDWSCPVWGKGHKPNWGRLADHVSNVHGIDFKEGLVVWGTTGKGIDSVRRTSDDA